MLQHSDHNKDGFLNFREFAAEFGMGAISTAPKTPAAPKRTAKPGAAPSGPGLLSGLAALAATKKADVSQERKQSKRKKAAHLDYAELSALGSLALVSGGSISISGDNVVSTRPGYRPTVSMRGVEITSGKWFYEVC